MLPSLAHLRVNVEADKRARSEDGDAAGKKPRHEAVNDFGTIVVLRDNLEKTPAKWLTQKVPERSAETLGQMKLIRNESAYGMLLGHIRNSILSDRFNITRLLKESCWGVSQEVSDKVKKFMRMTLDDNTNWEAQGLTSIKGREYSERLSLTDLRRMVESYETVWNSKMQPRLKPNGKFNLDDSQKIEIRRVLCEHATVFYPMIEAMRASGYATQNQTDFQVKYRFQQIRHDAAAVWHMDNGEYETYADDDTVTEDWTLSGTRGLVVAACLNMETSSTEQAEEWHHCGTNIANGVPVLRPQTLNKILKYLTDTNKEHRGNQACVDVLRFRTLVTRDLNQATEYGILDFERETRTPITATGVTAMVMENGVINDYNDYAFHKASKNIPEGYERVFFSIYATSTDFRGRPIPFRPDVTFMAEGVENRILARLMFQTN